MNTSLMNSLLHNYSELFDSTKRIPGIEYGEGWHELLNSTFLLISGHIAHETKRGESIQAELAKRGTDAESTIPAWVLSAEAAGSLPASKIVPVQIIQVKEKFGELRIYYRGGDQFIAGVIAMASHVSRTTCDQCGDYGQIVDNGWLAARCPKHAKFIPG